MIIKINKKDEIPVYQQIFNQIKIMIENGTLKPGDKLPSTRTMAESLQVNRSTVYNAYEELRAFGYIESNSGSYTFIRNMKIIHSETGNNNEKQIDWPKLINSEINTLYNEHISKKINLDTLKNSIDMISLTPDERLYPVKEFKSSLNYAISKYSDSIMTYGDPKGYYPLREFISERMKKYGINATPEEIIITNGSQNAIELIIKLFHDKNKKIALENPVYSSIWPLLKSFNAETSLINFEGGKFNYDKFIEENKKENISFIYTIPNFHNPLGITMNQEDREKLVDFSEKNNIPVVEDAFEEEMKYYGKTPLPLKAQTEKDLVIYTGSFSKVLFPGIRMGWICADKECIERLAYLKRISELSGNQLIQAGLYEFCREGHYDLHITRLNRIYKKRMKVFIDSMKKYIGNKVKWIQPTGGYLSWFEIENCNLDIEEINKRFIENGVILSKGELFYKDGKTDKKTFRISISRINEEEIEEGVIRISRTINNL